MSTHNFDVNNTPPAVEPILLAAVVFVVAVLAIVTALVATAS